MPLFDIKEIITKTNSELRAAAAIACDEQAENLPKYLKIQQQARLREILFDVENGNFSQDIAATSLRFEETQSWPSLTSLVFMTLEGMGMDFNSDEAKIMLTATSLGEIPNDLPYHGNAHYRKVMMATIRQISMHNNIYAGDEFELDAREIALLSAAASLHDFQHDGEGNGDVPSRLEMSAFKKSEPFLTMAGADKEFLADLETIILCTDVNPMGRPEAPSNRMKAMYKYHFMEGRTTKEFGGARK